MSRILEAEESWCVAWDSSMTPRRTTRLSLSIQSLDQDLYFAPLSGLCNSCCFSLACPLNIDSSSHCIKGTWAFFLLHVLIACGVRAPASETADCATAQVKDLHVEVTLRDLMQRKN